MLYPRVLTYQALLLVLLGLTLQSTFGQQASSRKFPVQLANSTGQKPTTASVSPGMASPTVGPARLTFAEAGYPDQALQGLSSTATYYLRIPPTATLQSGSLKLFLTPSQALQSNQSSVTVLVRNQPVLSLNVSQLPAGSPIVIPLSSASQEAGSPFVQVEIKTQLVITNDRCKDLENPALWLRVGSASSITYQTAYNANQKLNLSNCLAAKTAIVYPAAASATDIRLVSALYSRLTALRSEPIGLFAANQIPDSLNNLVVVGELASLPPRYRSLLPQQPQAHQGLFALRPATAGGPEILYVTGGGQDGYAKTVDAVSNPAILASAFGRFLAVSEAQQTQLTRPLSDRQSLAQLGGKSVIMQGIGSLRQLYNFRISDFSQQPDELETHLEARYSGLQAGDRGFLNLYINDVLFSSTPLDKSGLIAVSPKIKRYLLKPYNTIQAEFRFFPGTNICQNSFTSFFAQVDVQRSYLYNTTAYSAESLSFLQYPGAFQSKPLAVVVSPSQVSQAVPGVCELVRQLNLRPTSTLLIPPVYLSNAYKLSNEENLLAVLDRADPLWASLANAPLQFDRNFRLYGDDPSKPLFAVSDSVACGIAQVFRDKDRAVLLLSLNGPATADALRNTALHLTDQISSQASNVLISAGSNHFMFNLTEDSSNVDYYDRTDYARDWWSRYNLYVLGGLLVLVLLAFLYVRSKVRMSQALFDN
ncbi:cellulose biosynthesis cyclic di-GMP-binding regulatory protein BcsB [Spirosoma pomorum]